MKYIDLKKIIYMDHLIKHKSTGTPEEFAKKLNMSRSTYFDYLLYMREELTLVICYDRSNSTYYYEGEDLSAVFNKITLSIQNFKK